MKTNDIVDKISDPSVYFTANDFNKFSGTIFDSRLKRENLAAIKDLGTVEQRAIKKKETKKYKLLIPVTFSVKSVFVMTVFKICFSTFSKFDLKEDRETAYIIA